MVTCVRRTIVAVAAFAVVGVVLPGCEESHHPARDEWRLEMATFWFQPGLAVQLPDSVDAGKPFEAVVVTSLVQCARVGSEEVREVFGDVIEIVPKDWCLHSANILCPAVIEPGEHRITLQFAQAGEAHVRVTAWAYWAEGDSPITLERTVVVR